MCDELNRCILLTPRTTLNVNEWTLPEDNESCHIFAQRSQQNDYWQ